MHIVIYTLKFAIDVQTLESINLDSEVLDTMRGLGEVRLINREMKEIRSDDPVWIQKEE